MSFVPHIGQQLCLRIIGFGVDCSCPHLSVISVDKFSWECELCELCQRCCSGYGFCLEEMLILERKWWKCGTRGRDKFLKVSGSANSTSADSIKVCVPIAHRLCHSPGSSM